MTKTNKARERAGDWTFDMPAGLARHGPTGLQFRLEPLPGGHLAAGRADALQADGYTAAGECWLPDSTPDRRQAAQIAPGDANAPGVVRWAVLARHGELQAALDGLVRQHGPSAASQVLNRISREAGERWVFRARLERGWTDGRRAV